AKENSKSSKPQTFSTSMNQQSSFIFGTSNNPPVDQENKMIALKSIDLSKVPLYILKEMQKEVEIYKDLADIQSKYILKLVCYGYYRGGISFIIGITVVSTSLSDHKITKQRMIHNSCLECLATKIKEEKIAQATTKNKASQDGHYYPSWDVTFPSWDVTFPSWDVTASSLQEGLKCYHITISFCEMRIPPVSVSPPEYRNYNCCGKPERSVMCSGDLQGITEKELET
ncbi:14777_t:CDS:2, partial [Funneliformis mosseae]